MPELPEVETTCRSVIPYAVGHKVAKVIVRQYQLRWPICATLARILKNQTIESISRRGKYLLFICSKGTLIIHLGMSGKLSIVETTVLASAHDHVDFILSNGYVIRYTDPRKFGCIVWTTEDPNSHRLLAHLGIEPLTQNFSGQYLFTLTKDKKTTIKSLLMNAAIIVGVGNIYANEALFMAGIKPTRVANTLNLADCNHLVKSIKKVLIKAINKGGTTLQDFFNVDGKPGYFAQELMVYGREGKACYKCHTNLLGIRLNQRATVFCPKCQH